MTSALARAPMVTSNPQRNASAMPCRLARHAVDSADLRARPTATRRIPIKTTMIPIATRLVPVASRSICEAMRDVVDEMVCAETPEPFYAVGLWYDDFGQTTDDEVRALLEA